MIITISVTIIAVLFAYISSKPKYGLSMLFKTAFVLVTFLQVIHYDYGSDYMQYYNQHFLYTGTLQDFIHLSQMGYGAYRSIAWAVLNRLFPGELGFFFIVALISVIENVIFYKFITQNIERRNQWKSFAIYLFMTNLYLINFSALRQGFSVALAVLAMMMVSKKKPIPAIVILIIAALFHSSAIVMIPFVLLSLIPLKNGKGYGIIISVTSLLLFVSNTLVGNIFSRIVQAIPYIGSQYGLYYEDVQTAGSLGFGFFLRLVMFIVLIYFIIVRYKELSFEHKLFVLLSCVDLCIVPFQVNLSGMISRIEYYFLAFQVIAVPTVYTRIKDKSIRLCISAIYVFYLLFGYYNFFFVTEWSATSYEHFHTIFDVIFN